MRHRPFPIWVVGIVLASLLAGCGGAAPQPTPASALTAVPATVPASVPTAMPATEAPGTLPEPTVPPATEAAAPTGIPETATPLPTENPSELAATAIPTAVPFTMTDGKAVLNLERGNGAGQVGIAPNPNDESLLIGPPSFRIGADNSIRVLDRVNRRVLFFDSSGALARTQSIADALDPVDFIVNTRGEMFVYDLGDSMQSQGLADNKQVIRYNPAGDVIGRYPVHPEVFGDAIMLTALQDILIVGGSFGDNARAVAIFHDGKPVDPSHQTLTLKRGMPSPRSAVLFSTSDHQGGTTDLSIGVVTGESGPILSNLPVPAGARFLNVDRAMNLYFMKPDETGSQLHLWDVDTQGALVGGATVDFSNCRLYDWRSIYVAQDGALWTMWTTESGTVISRYDFTNQQGQPLPQAAAKAPDGIPWGAGGPNLAA
ncbi:MAG TPA: hypothetical protein VFT99_08420 [Roseiflexaceae bacterium]|nr:hypothetical protein [Roseiflexaceae bacterium]